jgi:hypothetical protein
LDNVGENFSFLSTRPVHIVELLRYPLMTEFIDSAPPLPVVLPLKVHELLVALVRGVQPLCVMCLHEGVSAGTPKPVALSWGQ